MKSPLKELETLQLRQIEDGYYQNDTDQIKEIINSIKILAFENIYNKINQQHIKVEESIAPVENDQITQYYRNQYKSIDIVEKSNIQSRIIKQKLQEYQTRNSPQNYRRRLPILSSQKKSQYSVLLGKYVSTPHTENKITLDKDKLTTLNKTMQQTFTNFTTKWSKHINKQPSQTCRNQGCRISKDQLNFTSLVNRTQTIFEAPQKKNINPSHFLKQLEEPTPTNYKDEQLAMDEIYLGNFSFQVPKVNQFLANEEFRVLRSRVEKRKKPNCLIIEQKYNKE